MKYLCCFCSNIINSEDVICEGANSLTYTRYFCPKCFEKGLHKLNEEELLSHLNNLKENEE